MQLDRRRGAGQEKRCPVGRCAVRSLETRTQPIAEQRAVYPRRHPAASSTGQRPRTSDAVESLGGPSLPPGSRRGSGLHRASLPVSSLSRPRPPSSICLGYSPNSPPPPRTLWPHLASCFLSFFLVGSRSPAKLGPRPGWLPLYPLTPP